MERLASAANLSPRQFARLFKLETGQTPGQAVRQMRVEHAGTMLDAGTISLKTIARKTGFRTSDQMRSAFHQEVGKAPRSLRKPVGLAD